MGTDCHYTANIPICIPDVNAAAIPTMGTNLHIYFPGFYGLFIFPSKVAFLVFYP